MVMSEMSESRWRARFFPALLLIFMVSFFAPISAKTSNNIFYAGLAVPTLIWWLRMPRQVLGPFRVSPRFFIAFALLTAVLGFKSPSFLKDSLYVNALFLSCVMINKNDAAVRRVFLIFAVAGLALLAIAGIEWAVTIRASGVAPRISLWGHAENPIFAALLIMSGIVYLWVFFIEERLAQWSGPIRWTAFLILVVLCVSCVVIFQARSAMIGFVFFVVGYVLQRQRLKPVAITLAVVLVLLYASGWAEILLERGSSHRLAIWEAAIQRLVENCGFLTGCGDDNHLLLGMFYHPHSAYVSALYQGGVLGLAMLGVMALVFFVTACSVHSRWFLVALVGWGGLVTTTSGVIASPRPLWVFFWIPTFMTLLEAGRPALEAYYRSRDEIRSSG